MMISNFQVNSEEELKKQVLAKLFINNDVEGIDGTVYATTKRVVFENKNGTIKFWPFTTILMHAICRDTSSFPHECIYFQLDSDDDLEEVRIVPNENDSIDELFNKLSECSALNPDPNEEEASDFITSEDFENSNENEILARFEAMLPQNGNENDEYIQQNDSDFETDDMEEE